MLSDYISLASALLDARAKQKQNKAYKKAEHQYTNAYVFAMSTSTSSSTPTSSTWSQIAASLRHPHNPVVFLDVEVGSTPLGRILLELFSDVCPKTAENFRQFCTGECKKDGIPQGFKVGRVAVVIGFSVSSRVQYRLPDSSITRLNSRFINQFQIL